MDAERRRRVNLAAQSQSEFADCPSFDPFGQELAKVRLRIPQSRDTPEWEVRHIGAHATTTDALS
jgi:hypothetical protein